MQMGNITSVLSCIALSPGSSYAILILHNHHCNDDDPNHNHNANEDTHYTGIPSTLRMQRGDITSVLSCHQDHPQSSFLIIIKGIQSSFLIIITGIPSALRMQRGKMTRTPRAPQPSSRCKIQYILHHRYQGAKYNTFVIIIIKVAI